MLAQQRRERILEEVRRQGAVRVSDLSTLLQVSDMTVRRDLEALGRQGLVEKVHGGATAVSRRPGRADEPAFATKAGHALAEKEAIARAAAGLVRPGAAVGVTAGTTTWMLAKYLAEIPGLTVVTNSVQVAEVLHTAPGPGQTLVLTGGTRTPSDALVGPVAVAAVASLNFDLLFMGVHGMDEQSGFTTPNLMEADTDRAMCRAGRRLVVLADHTKWGVVGLSSIARLDDADVLVSDDALTPEARSALEEHVGELLVTHPSRPEPDQ